jgi:hypothetical protein
MPGRAASAFRLASGFPVISAAISRELPQSSFYAELRSRPYFYRFPTLFLQGFPYQVPVLGSGIGVFLVLHLWYFVEEDGKRQQETVTAPCQLER